MSTKKQRRAERRRQEKEKKEGRRFNPATLFVLSIAALLLIVGLVSHFAGGGRDAPYPGAVWSAEHQHWH